MKNAKRIMVMVMCSVGCWAGVAPAAEGSDASAAASLFERFFVDGGPLVWLLLALSLLAIKLIVEYLLLIRRTKLAPAAVGRQTANLLRTSRTNSTLEWLAKQDNLLGRTLHMGLSQASNGRAAIDTGIAEMLEQQSSVLHRKVEWLNIIGNVAPMIGLFGTVWGMINAFNSIVRAGGQPEPADLAEGISVALVTTWWGLIVAIPALAAFGFLRNRINAIAAEVAVIAEEILADV